MRAPPAVNLLSLAGIASKLFMPGGENGLGLDIGLDIGAHMSADLEKENMSPTKNPAAVSSLLARDSAAENEVKTSPPQVVRDSIRGPGTPTLDLLADTASLQAAGVPVEISAASASASALVPMSAASMPAYPQSVKLESPVPRRATPLGAAAMRGLDSPLSPLKGLGLLSGTE